MLRKFRILGGQDADIFGKKFAFFNPRTTLGEKTTELNKSCSVLR